VQLYDVESVFDAFNARHGCIQPTVVHQLLEVRRNGPTIRPGDRSMTLGVDEMLG
jgi:hypothetical protein